MTTARILDATDRVIGEIPLRGDSEPCFIELVDGEHVVHRTSLIDEPLDAQAIAERLRRILRGEE